MSLVGNGIKSEETGKSSITRAFTSLFLGIRTIQIKGNWGKGTLSTGPIFHTLIEKYIKYYNEQRIKQKLGWMSPVEYRLSLLAA